MSGTTFGCTTRGGVMPALASATLPRPTSSFVGRDVEIADVSRLLCGDGRLLTLTGPGGAGKSRLAIEASERLREKFDGGIFWVSLTVLRDPRLLITTIAGVLNTNQELVDHIGHRSLLLVLDNFEQIIQAGPDLLAVLEACPNLHVLVTSRERLRIAGETEYPVPPMAALDAVELFCARANTSADDTIAELCHRLDNLPLALELAAARTSVLTPGQILSRLGDRLDLFRGDRGVEPRQQTLRAAIEWSCQLLDATEVNLFTRLAVFEGGCTIDAAERVAGADIDVLQSLVDKSLVRHSGERFLMLERIREYAVELLNAHPRAAAVRARHLAWCIDFLHAAERELPRGRSDLSRAMEQEFGNVRAAVHWSIATGQTESALQLVRPRLMWQSVQAHTREGSEWIEMLLDRADDVSPELRARVLRTAGDLRRSSGDLDGARSALQSALDLLRDLGDDTAIAETAYLLGRVELTAGAYAAADEVTRTGLVAAHTAGSELVAAELSAQLAEIAYRRGDVVDARSRGSDVAEHATRIGDAHSAAEALRVLAMLERDQGNPDGARSLAERSLQLTRDLCETYCLSLVLGVLGTIELQDGHAEAARARFTEALELQWRVAQWHSAIDSLWGMAATAVALGQIERGARLLGAEQHLREHSGSPFQVGSEGHRTDVWSDLRRRAEEPALSGWVRAGESLTRDDAVVLALSTSDGTVTASPAPAGDSPSVLRRDGDYWTVIFDKRAFKLHDSKGVHYLALLLRSPGREFHALDMASGGRSDPAIRLADLDASSQHLSGGDAEPILDAQAKASYRSRLLELEEDLTEAQSWSDAGRVTRINDEIEFVTHELTGAMGLGGRDRRAASDAERARINVTRAIRSTLARIRKYDEGCADHLDVTVRTGMYCAYIPDPRTPINWLSAADDELIPLTGARPAPTVVDAGLT